MGWNRKRSAVHEALHTTSALLGAALFVLTVFAAVNWHGGLLQWAAGDAGNIALLAAAVAIDVVVILSLIRLSGPLPTREYIPARVPARVRQLRRR